MSIVLAQEAANDTYLLWGFVLLAAVIVLVAVELFVPTGGILGAMAGVCGLGSIVAFFMYDATGGMVALSLYIVLTPIMLWAIFKYWLNSPLASKMILGGAEEVTRSQEDAVAETERARAERLAELRAMIGSEGETVTALRPVGTVKIDGQRVDALAEAGTIEARTRVVVTDVYDNQIKVRPV